MKSFPPFRLDTANHCLLRNDERIPIAPKAFDVLRYLVENPERLVTQNELLNAVWPDTYVNPEILRKYILDIRKILGDRSDQPTFVETVTKRGYRFIAPVLDDSSAEPSDALLSPPADSASEAATIPPEPEISPGRKSVRWLPAILLLVTASILLVGYLWFHRARATPSSVAESSIVVLPFVDMSPDKDQEYFSDGLTEELINDLAKVPHLKVVARSSAFQFKGKNEDLRTIGRKLGVTNVLEGSVRREGNRVRITAELTKARDGFQLWSETYDREISHIFTTQDEIAHSVSDALQLKLLSPSNTPSSPTSPTANADAYQAYLQAQYFSARGQDKEDLEKALSYAEQAAQLDPSYAPAWAQRATLLERLASIAIIDNTDGFRRARESAEKAIVLDPDLAGGYLALGLIQIDHDWDWKGADASLRKAGQLEPGNGDIVNARAYLAKAVGHLDGAVALSKQAITVDPLRANSHLELGYDLYLVGRFAEAEPELQRAEDLNPQLSGLYLTRGEVFLARGRAQDALAEMQRETGDWQKSTGEALAYFALDRASDSEHALQQLIATHQNNCAFQIAEIYAFRGETDKAFHWMDRAVRQRDPGAPQFRTDPLMKGLPRDARYAELSKQTHLPVE